MARQFAVLAVQAEGQKLSQPEPLTDISAVLGISMRQLERKFAPLSQSWKEEARGNV